MSEVAFPQPVSEDGRLTEECRAICNSLGVDFAKFSRIFVNDLKLPLNGLHSALSWYRVCFSTGHNWMTQILSHLNSCSKACCGRTLIDIHDLAYDAYVSIKRDGVSDHCSYALVHLWRFVQIAQGADWVQHELGDL